MKELVRQVGPRARLKSNIEQWSALLPGYTPVPPAQDLNPIFDIDAPGTSGELNDSLNSTQGASGSLSDLQEQEAPVITLTPLQRLVSVTCQLLLSMTYFTFFHPLMPLGRRIYELL